MNPSLDRARPTEVARVVTFADTARHIRDDLVAGEEPLEIRIDDGRSVLSIATTMRTPGHDFELAAGFLFSEGVIREPDDIREIRYCTDSQGDDEQHYNVVTVRLSRVPRRDVALLERHFFMTSACGVCGRASIDSLQERGLATIETSLRVAPQVLYNLPEALRKRQRVFETTGGLHAAAFFDARGTLCALREDVGRHNALDKLIGALFLERRIPARDGIVLVSGRTSYELVQKTIAAGAPILCSVSAPSNLAVTLAQRFGLTLVGFLRGKGFNVYTGDCIWTR